MIKIKNYNNRTSYLLKDSIVPGAFKAIQSDDECMLQHEVEREITKELKNACIHLCRWAGFMLTGILRYFTG